MNKFLILILTTMLLNSCNNDPKQNLIGEWKEFWGVGVETDVNYNEIYKITMDSDGQLTIICQTYNSYLFDKVLFDGKELSFRKENTSDPQEKFYVFYKLKLSEDGKWMEGPINNSRGQTDYLKWHKLNNKSNN